jgi:hypothetical protein
MRWSRLFLALMLLMTVVALRPLAEASPPDPTWIAGLYDNADFDDVILAILTTAAVLHVAPADAAQPSLIVLGRLSDPVFAPLPTRADLVSRPRSPPSH